jgi:flavin-dependent dehydrogenase
MDSEVVTHIKLPGHVMTLIIAFAFQMAWGAETVLETAKEIPLAYDVDVVVAGGSLAGVEAACAAAAQGGSVLLVESRPYLGYDLCASQKLWLNDDEEPTTPLTKSLFGGKKRVTPMQVKCALDNALLESDVQFLTGSFPAELLVTKEGIPGGITTVNRSGRQAIRAKVVIDATANAVLARQTGATFKPFTPGARKTRFIRIGGKPPEGLDAESARKLPADFVSGYWDRKSKKRIEKNYPAYEYTLTTPMESDSFRARSKALNEIRTRAYDAGMTDHSEQLLCFPDNPVVALPDNPFRPSGVENLYVLSAYAGLEEPLRRQLWESPCRFAEFGVRIGTDAGELAKTLDVPNRLDYGSGGNAAGSLSVSEGTPSFRFRHCPRVKTSAHPLPILGKWDVVVVGGGTSGAPAGIGAARSGAKTLVIEYLDELGGVGTAGLIAIYWYGRENGFTAEMDSAMGIEKKWSPTKKSEWLRMELLKNGAEIWFGSFGCGAVMNGDKVAGVVVATPLGRGIVLADTVVDGTGNADIAAAAGADTHYSISALGDLTVQVAGYPDRRLGHGVNNTAYAMLNDNDILDRTHFLLNARRNAGRGTYDMGQLIDTRDRRRIVGDHILTTQDILTKRTFPDTISHHRSNFDAGAIPDDLMFMLKDMKGPVYTCDMPYRCLTPEGVEGLLVVGLGASAHRDAMTLTRMQPDLQNQGYAAGMAAAMAVGQTQGRVREIDLKQLQKKLVENDCLEKRVLTDRDSFPMGEDALRKAVETLHALTIEVHQKNEHNDTLPALAAVMGNPEQAIPLLRRAFRKSDKPETKINFARILAVLGDSTGKETLLKAVDDATHWGQGWDFSNQRKLANSFGEVDRLVIALGFLRTPEVHPPLLRKLEALTAQSPLSHYKAVCLALRLTKDKSLAEPLAELLNREGVGGHVQPLGYYEADAGRLQTRHRINKDGGAELNAKFKEVLVAALLFECGDDNGQGREILEAYTKDVNGHFAEYAHCVLENGTAMSEGQ